MEVDETLTYEITAEKSVILKPFEAAQFKAKVWLEFKILDEDGEPRNSDLRSYEVGPFETEEDLNSTVTKLEQKFRAEAEALIALAKELLKRGYEVYVEC